jgi:hypothetical protein
MLLSFMCFHHGQNSSTEQTTEYPFPFSAQRAFNLVGQLVGDNMIPPAPSKILIGISLDPDHSIELLSWATRVLAQSNDTIVAIHVLGQHL